VIEMRPILEKTGVPRHVFLSQRGLLVDNGDMARNASFFENWSHFNHAGAMMASERVASAIAAMKISKLDQSKAQ